MQVAFYFADEITQVLDAVPWVRCASGNVLLFIFPLACLLKFSCFSHFSRHHSDQMSEGSQVSKVTICIQIQKWQWVSEWPRVGKELRTILWEGESSQLVQFQSRPRCEWWRGNRYPGADGTRPAAIWRHLNPRIISTSFRSCWQERGMDLLKGRSQFWGRSGSQS